MNDHKMYEVIVGNIGSVYKDSSVEDAIETYNSYVKKSMESYGRASGENVTLFIDGEPLFIHTVEGENE